MRGIDANVLLACGYAVFLAGLAAGLELLARHSHKRSETMRTVGFTYHPDLDIWKCPNRKHLYRTEVTRESTSVLYRAAAHDCNSCPIKLRCTDSDAGRTLRVHSDSWLQSELRRFHRGLSLTLLLLADLILVLTILTNSDVSSEVAAGFLLLCITGSGLRLAADFFQTKGRHSPVLRS